MADEIWAGLLGGLLATFFMTIFMLLAQRMQNKGHERLPPEIITQKTASRAGLWSRLNDKGRMALWAAAHFGYGTACAFVYVLILKGAGLYASIFTGALFGFLVWALSYKVLLPALHILPPPEKRSWRESALMIPAHLIWGSALGLTVRMVL